VIKIARAAATLVLVVAFATLPMAIDWCAASCDAAHSAGASPAAACHHTAAQTSRVGQMPAPCSRDHHGAPVVTVSGQTAAPRGPIAGVAPFATPALTIVPPTIARVVAPPPHRLQYSIPLALSASLRI
jgi:hypothetical protein